MCKPKKAGDVGPKSSPAELRPEELFVVCAVTQVERRRTKSRSVRRRIFLLLPASTDVRMVLLSGGLLDRRWHDLEHHATTRNKSSYALRSVSTIPRGTVEIAGSVHDQSGRRNPAVAGSAQVVEYFLCPSPGSWSELVDNTVSLAAPIVRCAVEIARRVAD